MVRNRFKQSLEMDLFANRQNFGRFPKRWKLVSFSLRQKRLFNASDWLKSELGKKQIEFVCWTLMD